MKKLFAIFGNPVEHSKSPQIHNYVFKRLNYDAVYIRYLLEDGNTLKEKFFELGLSGVNVTVPHKEAAYNACDEIRGFANEVGVVNTIVLEDDKLIGYNTDADGFIYSISKFKDIKKVLFLGAGGTCKALSKKFLNDDFDVSIANRSSKRLKEYSDSFKKFTYDELDIYDFDIVINTTSAGLEDDSLPINEEKLKKLFENANYAADVIYGKQTPFLKLAKSMNLESKDGLDMLIAQGAIASSLFMDESDEIDTILELMSEALRL
jgi:shikimate dehydrogenase